MFYAITIFNPTGYLPAIDHDLEEFLNSNSMKKNAQQPNDITHQQKLDQVKYFKYMKYINIINVIFTILLKKINEDIAQGTENYNEFSVVSRNLKSEFVKIKTVNVETGEEDFIHISLSFILFYAITR